FGVGLLPGEAVTPDFQIKFVAERVHAGNAHAVQSAGHFVRRSVELAAGMQLCHYDLGGGNLFAVDVHVVNGNAAAVIDDGNRVVDVNGGFDLVSETGESFVHRVVDNFVNQMM